MRRQKDEAVEVIRSNPKYFYSFAKRRSKTRPPIGPICAEGELIEEDERMVELLQTHYCEMYSSPFFSAMLDPPLKRGVAQTGKMYWVLWHLIERQWRPH